MSEKNLLISNKILMDEWDYDKNDVSPVAFTQGSSRKVWWKCKKGHSWEATIASRIRGNKCPYCSHRRVLAGFNDLATRYPKIAAEWAYEKNGDLLPTQFMPENETKVWWKCDKGHYWRTAICNRKRGSKCPYCSGHFVMSGFNDLQTKNPSLAKEWDFEKNAMLPSEFAEHSGKSVWWKCSKGHSWQTSICNRAKGSGCPYCNNRKVMPGENDLVTRKPELLKEWDYDKNKILPSQVIFSSRQKVWWKCSKGHSWQGSVSDRTGSKKEYCPYCSGRQFVKGINDLATRFPELAKQWDCEKNGKSPTEISISYREKVWWICEHGHSWQTTIIERRTGKGCPYCSNNYVYEGFNDLATKRPDILKEWDYEKNKILPTQVTKASKKKVWWKCSNGHSWMCGISDRTSGGNGCPYCSGKKVLEGYNDLQTLRSDIAKEWDYEKNELLPTQVTIASLKKVWWKCREGHSWKATVSSRGRDRYGCPYCANKKVLKGYNDLATVNPDIAKEWDYDKNTLLPSEVTRCSGKKVWWKCKNGHSWKITVSSRTNGSGCPYCCNQKILAGYNDLQTLEPKIASEWDYDKNKLKPSEVAAYTNKKFWWKCQNGHSWKSAISARTKEGQGCPYCVGKVQYIPKCVY